MAATIPLIIASVAGAVVTSALAPKPGQAPELAAAPVAEKPTVMPTANDAQATAAKKKSIAEQVAAQGRASTILTDKSDTLG